MDKGRIVSELKAERERITKAIVALEGLGRRRSRKGSSSRPKAGKQNNTAPASLPDASVPQSGKVLQFNKLVS